MVTVIRTDPVTGKVTVATVNEKDMNKWEQEWERLHPRPFNHFYCSYCDKVSIIRPSQDFNSTTQFCVNCYKWRIVSLIP